MLKNNLTNFLKENEYDYLLVNSTNEFLVEYNALEQNARYYLTGFSGSTGEALLDKNGEINLFVDGRYHKQADNQANKDTNVVKLQLGETLLNSLTDKICENSKLAVISTKISLNFYNNLKSTLSKKNIEIIPLDFDPIFNFVEKQQPKKAQIIDIPIFISGKTAEEKIKEIQKDLKENDTRLVTNLEQIAWILNKRCFAQNFSSCFDAKLIINKEDYQLFCTNQIQEYKNFLKITTKNILYVPKHISYSDFLIIKNKSTPLDNDLIERKKALKNEAELAHMQKCFNKTDIVVTKISNYINSAQTLTEQELVKLVEKEFFAQGAKSLSFNTILASGKNSALAHYATDMEQKTEIKKGDLVLLDCGAYFEGGYATDITRVFCFGEPNNLAKQVYTTVLKANLNAYNCEITKNTRGFDIDKIARDIINNAKLPNFNFNHATGHGVGISVHEFPPSISPTELAKNKLKDSMVFTIEPGAYNPDFGGVRLENTVYLKNNKINSFSKIKFEEKLIDRTLLNEEEKQWLDKWQKEALWI